MIQGKVNAALRYVSNNANGGILQLNDVVDESKGQKHPEQQPLLDSVLLQGPVEDIPAVIYS